MDKIKCIECDGLGYFYNIATFQSEHCPKCNGRGAVDANNTQVETPVEAPAVVETPVVEAPKPKKTKAPVVEAPVEPELPTDEPAQPE